MGAACYRTLAVLRRRVRATLLLALLVGLIGGMVLTASPVPVDRRPLMTATAT